MKFASTRTTARLSLNFVSIWCSFQYPKHKIFTITMEERQDTSLEVESSCFFSNLKSIQTIFGTGVESELEMEPQNSLRFSFLCRKVTFQTNVTSKWWKEILVGNVWNIKTQSTSNFFFFYVQVSYVFVIQLGITIYSYMESVLVFNNIQIAGTDKISFRLIYQCNHWSKYALDFRVLTSS